MATLRDRGWAYFDAIVAAAPLRDVNPWTAHGGATRFEPDYDTLELLLGASALLHAASQSGVPALALDVWVSYELRRAGFDGDRVWPRPSAPRVLPAEVAELLARLPARDRAGLWSRIERGAGGRSSANILGKHYVKQVDVVMSSWATGPELMVSTKRMDSSFGKNAANRVEESYGDAKNLRLRHPQAALGFLYSLSAAALTREPEVAAWLVDLLAKLGREDDAYDAVALVVPKLPGDAPVAAPEDARVDLAHVTPVRLDRDAVPDELDPGRFFAVMCRRVLDDSPVTFHAEARRRRASPAVQWPAPKVR